MATNSLRPQATKILDPMARFTANAGISPNVISILSLLFALFAGLLYYYSAFNPMLVLVAGILVALNSFFDAIDGPMARYLDIANSKGDFLDHLIDRYSDVFIITGIFFGVNLDLRIGVMALIGVLLTSYLGTQAQALRLGRYYGGIIGRADRMVLIIFSSIIYYLYPGTIFGFCVLGWMIIVIGVGSHITAFQRIAHIWKHLN